ncbi:[formate-C-acetyltransferase]-activating enzyme [Pseudovibrio sp. SPO723]|uniref:[formate-C-acetyltransferase]-activating enzyme n=1 Tax=Nesiotobacter zosterae TaxID=392721 RepID=UPI0029C50B51|nr:[formate-C-acetyltransferase]-activating enzyme [Pseudovibrio sp. SPO723]MDX5592182.1 [formate-C-acetyltransferase]-activating enzyme [Pseudovibrio sp. SPO723]
MTSFAERPMSSKPNDCLEGGGDGAAPSTGRVFNIQRYSLNDGEGIRTVVFLKGCPLSCPWCSNPESRSSKPQVIRRETKCIHCEVCSWDVAECPSGALELVGTDMTMDELLKEIEKDDVFYRSSGGGVTLSGGEVLTQARFAIELLKRLKRLGYNTAIETTGHGNTALLMEMSKYCDEVLYDFKIMDPETAKKTTGINLQRSLDNFRGLIAQGTHVVPRIPLIPGYTMHAENIQAILDYLSEFDLKEVHLLPFHQFGANKYETFEMEYELKDVPVPTDNEVEAIKALVEARGYKVNVGG